MNVRFGARFADKVVAAALSIGLMILAWGAKEVYRLNAEIEVLKVEVHAISKHLGVAIGE